MHSSSCVHVLYKCLDLCRVWRACAYDPSSAKGDTLLPLEKTLREDRDDRLQGDVDMTVDDMLRLLGEGGGLDRNDGDACAMALALILLPPPTGTTLRRLTLTLLSKLLDLE
mmetsp:Transcript_23472/g.46716  ORF Transcript_23472/g.46716 Transcript_23472/m.46716 type:complete len:112 (+) Transcript_23472:92-427(+)